MDLFYIHYSPGIPLHLVEHLRMFEQEINLNWPAHANSTASLIWKIAEPDSGNIPEESVALELLTYSSTPSSVLTITPSELAGMSTQDFGRYLIRSIHGL